MTEADASGGFVAADAIVAVTIAGILLAIVYEAGDRSANAQRRAWDRRMASAEAELQLIRTWPSLSAPGRLALDHGSVEVEAIAVPEKGLGLCRVTSRVMSADGRLAARLETQRLCAGAAG